MRKTMLLLFGLPAAGAGTATMTRTLSVLLAFCFICGASGSLAAPPTSPEPAKPHWQAKLSVEETDFIEFISKDRVLVGTVNTGDFGGGLQPHEIVLMNSVTGEKLWAAPRGSYGSPQTLLDVDPVILIEGSKQFVALNPVNGAVLWSRERAGETSLQLPAHNLIAFLARKAAPMTISAVNVKTGSEAWRTPIENYSVDKGTKLDVTIMGDAVLLSGPEVAAFSAADGKLLWRMPFPGTFGPKSSAIPLGDDLYFSDGSAITRSDPASGKQLWRAAVSNGAFQALTTNKNSVFLLSKGSGENSPDSITALDRNTGKQLWNVSLPDRAASPISTEEDLLFLTTPANVIALDAQDGSVVFKTTIPAELQSRRQLPDNLRIESGRIIVAREDGVLAVRKSGGKLLFADQIPGGKGFTYDYSTDIFRHATSVPGNKKHPVQLNSDSASPEDNYRVAVAQQQVAYNAIRVSTQRSMDSTNLILYGSSRPTFQQQQQAGRGAAVAGAAIGAGMAVVGAFNAVYVAREVDTYQERVKHTFLTHASSLQDKFYIRPSYEQSSGWSLYIVNLETGEHASVLLTLDADEDPNMIAAHLPAFSIDGSRIVSKGIGPNPEWVKAHKFHLGLAGLYARAVVAYPSVLAFDLASLHFTQDAKTPATNPVDPAKSKLNDQLLEAAYRNDLEAAKNALDAGANVNAVDEYGNTALMLAAEASVRSGKDPLIELLLGRGANADIRDSGGLTAFQHVFIPLVTVSGAWNPRAMKDLHKAQKEHK
jgi:outer membrane protein assembly factor BamB